MPSSFYNNDSTTEDLKLETELTSTVSLANARGRLNPDARGWSRQPLHHCHIPYNSGRKKRWNYWGIIGPTHLYTVFIVDVDYLGFAASCLLDLESGRIIRDEIKRPLATGLSLGNTVRADAAMTWGNSAIHFEYGGGHVGIGVRWPGFAKLGQQADLVVNSPADQESINVVIPWSEKRFQFTSKQMALAAHGAVTVGNDKIDFPEGESFAVHDFGRGVWPYESRWNWATFSGRATDGTPAGFNLGGIWTDGTGMTENGFMVGTSAFKIPESVRFEYDQTDPLKTWLIKSVDGDSVNLQFEPIARVTEGINLGILKARLLQLFGRFSGTLRQDGQVLEIDGQVGWAEEQNARW